MHFVVKATRHFPVEISVHPESQPDMAAVFHGPGAQERAEQYAQWMNGADAPEAPKAE